MQVKGFFQQSSGSVVEFTGTVVREYKMAGLLPAYAVQTESGVMHTLVSNAEVVETEMVDGAVVGKGKSVHIAEKSDGTIWGVRCGAGLGRGVRKNSAIRDLGKVEMNEITCRKCQG